VACLPGGGSPADKYWCAVNRIDGVYGDRNLVCSCPPMEAYTTEAAQPAAKPVA
jgi:glycine dehydrogenase